MHTVGLQLCTLTFPVTKLKALIFEFKSSVGTSRRSQKPIIHFSLIDVDQVFQFCLRGWHQTWGTIFCRWSLQLVCVLCCRVHTCVLYGTVRCEPCSQAFDHGRYFSYISSYSGQGVYFIECCSCIKWCIKWNYNRWFNTYICGYYQHACLLLCLVNFKRIHFQWISFLFDSISRCSAYSNPH